jgi:exopolysaccharide biosynthesis polyprenyl glycosylphosphotransferase
MNGKQPLSERPTIEPRWLLPLVDTALVGLAFWVSYFLRYDWQILRPVLDPRKSGFSPYVPFALIFAGLLYFNYYNNGLYRRSRGRTWSEEVALIVNSVATATVILLALFFILQPEVTSRLMLIYVAGMTIVFHAAARVVQRVIMAYFRAKGVGVQRVMIIGMGETGQAVLRVMIARRELDYKVVGYMTDETEDKTITMEKVREVVKIDDLRKGLRQLNVDLVVITLHWQQYHRIQDIARICRDENVDVRIVPDIFQLNLRQVQVENLDGIPLLGINGTEPLRGAGRLFKRALDLTIVTVTAPIWGLVMGLVALAIKLDDNGPVLYTTRRIGENGREFDMVKFRSMIPGADSMRDEVIGQSGEDPRHPKPKDDPRITRVGRFIRRASLDELPNIFNVIKGEMSLVGPRPPLPEEVALYEPWHLRRLQIIPGMTGLWQVSGRSEVPFDEMCLMDIYYIENWSIKFDVQILMMTVPRVLLRSGAY